MIQAQILSHPRCGLLGKKPAVANFDDCVSTTRPPRLQTYVRRERRKKVPFIVRTDGASTQFWLLLAANTFAIWRELRWKRSANKDQESAQSCRCQQRQNTGQMKMHEFAFIFERRFAMKKSPSARFLFVDCPFLFFFAFFLSRNK